MTTQKIKAEVRPPSPAMAFLLAAQEAMPRSIGDRVRISGMCASLVSALECKFKFHKEDAEQLKRLKITTCVGVFHPDQDQYYSLACTHGSSFAKVWELARNIDPWIGHKVVANSHRSRNTLRGSRVAKGFCVLINSGGTEDGGNLARTATEQVWWCTSFDNEQIVLARYEFSPDSRHPFTRAGSPAKLMKLDRAQWNEMQNAQAALEAVEPLEIQKVAAAPAV